MAETLISPGVLARENDQSQVTSQPVQAGACIVGPTVLGKAGIPKLVTSYSEFLSNFGSSFQSGSDEYSYFTSISAYNYFNNGGTSLIVNRVVSGSFGSANTSIDQIRNDEQSTELNVAPFSFTGSIATSAQGGNTAASPFVGVAVQKNGVATTGTTFNVSRGIELGKLVSDTAGVYAPALLATVNGGSVAADLLDGPYDGINLTAAGATSATANFTVAGNAITVAGLATPGSGYENNMVVNFPAGTFGTGALKYASAITSLQGNASVGLATPSATAAVASFTTSGAPDTVATITANLTKTPGKLFVGADLKIAGGAAIPSGTTTGNATGTVTVNLDDITGITRSSGTGGSVTFTAAGSEITTIVVAATEGSNYLDGGTIEMTAAQLDGNATITAALGAIGGNTITLVLQEALDIATECTEIDVSGNAIANAGKGYVAGNTITIAAATIGQTTDAVFALTSGDLVDSGAGSFTVVGGTTQATSNILNEVTSVTLNTQNAADTFAVNDVLTVAANLIGDPLAPPGSQADLTMTVTGADLIDDECFRLETLTDGIVMNSNTNPLTPEGANGTLPLGTSDNIRWEIQGVDTATGTFSLIIRQGNDTATAKRVLEIFPNVSLDPKSSNYIERVVGNQTKVLNGSGTSDPYISTVGSYPNSSRYVRVSAVDAKTPDYFDNNGQPKAAFASYLPDVASGSFTTGTGALISNNSNGLTPERYYDAITDTNTQGIKAGDEGINQYTDAFNLLANKDDYSYNIITAPGLYHAASMMKTPLNLLIQNTQGRGDAIAIVDLVSYSAGTITTAKSAAADIDNSYAAAYWPWVQINDPDTGQLVWTVPSSMIPGVYAYNDRTSEAWFAPAGINRGGLSTVVQAQRKLTQTNRDDLYTGKVNPIATFPGRGVVVFGQKTLQSQASALDRINVRRLLIALKSYIVQIADNLVFEQNTAATRNNFLSQVNPYLESVQQRQGLYAFKVVMDASNNGPDVVDRNQMVGAIYIQPTKTAEFIYLDFNILPTGAEFPS